MTEKDRVIDAIHKGYVETKGRMNNKRVHPSRQEFGDILAYAQAWALTLQQIERQNGGEKIG